MAVLAYTCAFSALMSMNSCSCRLNKEILVSQKMQFSFQADTVKFGGVIALGSKVIMAMEKKELLSYNFWYT